MRKFLFILALFFCMVSNAQGTVEFILTPDGYYKTEEGQDYTIVQFDGKTAHQIYQELASNINSIYNKPSEVMNGVEDSSIKVRAYSNDLIRARALGLGQSLGGYYQLEFQIKDGRVRVSAPYIESKVGYMTPKGYSESNFRDMLKKHFKKDGTLKDGKRAEDYTAVVLKMNNIINLILNLSDSQQSEDW